MCNKFIILSFALASYFTSVAQTSRAQKPAQEVEISVYPNPAQEYLMVQIDEEKQGSVFELNSMIGNKIVITPESLGSGKYKIPVKQLATGYYFLVVKNEDRQFSKAYKFLKR
ncbi:MAG: T9SS type A sorting domain-containing protein [Bacteroidota bacterium]